MVTSLYVVFLCRRCIISTPYGKGQIYFTITQIPDMDMWHPKFAARTNSVPVMCYQSVSKKVIQCIFLETKDLLVAMCCKR